MLERMVTECGLTRDLLTLVEGDLLDYDSLIAGIPDDCDVVFHVAAVVGLANSTSAYEEQYRANVEGTTNVVEACLKKKVRRVVYTSTIGTITDVTTGVDNVITEKTTQIGGQSRSGYTRTKYLGEKVVLDAMERGLNIVILHPTFIIGTYDKDQIGAFAQFLGNTNQPFTGVGGGSFCDAEQCAIAHVVAGEKAANGSRYIIGGHYYTWKEVVESMLKQYNKETCQPWVIPRYMLVNTVRMVDIACWCLGKKNMVTVGFMESLSSSFKVDCTKAEQDLGLKYKPIDDMTKSCIDWIKGNPDLLQLAFRNIVQ
eukprot:gene1420-1646_t